MIGLSSCPCHRDELDSNCSFADTINSIYASPGVENHGKGVGRKGVNIL